MKEEIELTEESLSVPQDMVIDILSIIVKEGIKHEVTKVIESRALIFIAVFYDEKLSRHQKIKQNIQNLLRDYSEYRWAENEQLDWRES